METEKHNQETLIQKMKTELCPNCGKNTYTEGTNTKTGQKERVCFSCGYPSVKMEKRIFGEKQDSKGKEVVRLHLIRKLRQSLKGRCLKILDLFGGGGMLDKYIVFSSKLQTKSDIVVVEENPIYYEKLDLYQKHLPGLNVFKGKLEDWILIGIPRNFIWLDFCGNWSARASVIWELLFAKKMLENNSYVYVTLLGARDNLSGNVRYYGIPFAMAEIANKWGYILKPFYNAYYINKNGSPFCVYGFEVSLGKNLQWSSVVADKMSKLNLINVPLDEEVKCKTVVFSNSYTNEVCQNDFTKEKIIVDTKELMDYQGDHSKLWKGTNMAIYWKIRALREGIKCKYCGKSVLEKVLKSNFPGSVRICDKCDKIPSNKYKSNVGEYEKYLQKRREGNNNRYWSIKKNNPEKYRAMIERQKPSVKASYQKMRNDPIKYKEYKEYMRKYIKNRRMNDKELVEKERMASRDRFQKIKSDPMKYEKHKEYQREYRKKNCEKINCRTTTPNVSIDELRKWIDRVVF